MIKILDDPKFLKLDFYHGIIKELLGTLDSGNYMASMILGCCCIDYMSVPIAQNGKNTNEHFKKFIKEYMSSANNKYSEIEWQKDIYAIRCSLVHVFGESDAQEKRNFNPIFQVSSSAPHLIRNIDNNGNNRIYISIPHFVSDVISGVDKFFRETTEVALLKDWYKKLIILNSMQGGFIKLGFIETQKINHSQIHPFLSCLDNDAYTYKDISDKISEAFLRKHSYWTE